MAHRQKIIRVKDDDGSVREVTYRFVPVEQQMAEIRAHYNTLGMRQSEIAMSMAELIQHPKDRLKLHKALVITGKVVQT